MKLSKMFKFTFWRKWVGFNFDFYTYDGSDGRRVIDWMAHCGFFAITKYKIANQGRP